MHKWCAIMLIVLGPSVAWAEQTGSSGGGATGFMLDVELNVASPSFLTIPAAGTFLATGWNLSPRLVLGGQIRRFAIGATFSVNLSDEVDNDLDPDVDPPASWALSFGPAFDVEVWSRSSAALFISAGVPITVSVPSEDVTGAGFGLDVALGGRYWFDRWIALGLKAGSLVNFVFWNEDNPSPAPDTDWMSVSWVIYGAIELRFVAGS